MQRPKILVLSQMFPSRQFPSSGTFVMERAEALSEFADVRVISPVPLAPPIPGSGRYARFAKVERSGQTQSGLQYWRPRYFVLPKLAGFIQGYTLARATMRTIRESFGPWRPDVIDSHFAFPDGFAAVKVGRSIGSRAFITCHGSDLAKLPGLAVTGKLLRWALKNADQVFAVSPHLKQQALQLGCDNQRLTFLPNAVDTQRFSPRDKTQCRQKLNLPAEKFIAICVASLDANKNQIVLLRMMSQLAAEGQERFHLVLLGGGPDRKWLQSQADQMGIQSLVTFAGVKPFEEVPLWMSAADVLVLCSKREGWPTVYFEAMACGLPIISANLPSAPFAICKPELGLIVPDNLSGQFALAIKKLASQSVDSNAIRNFALEHSWQNWATQMMKIVRDVCGQSHAPPAVRIEEEHLI